GDDRKILLEASAVGELRDAPARTRGGIVHRLIVVAVFAISLVPLAHAQDAPTPDRRAEARRLLDTAEAHYGAGLHARAAQTWLEAHAVLVEIGNRMAPLALWNAGESLTRVPGREREARDLLRRFLEDSTAITDDAGVRDDRSRALELIQDLEARIELGQDVGDASAPSAAPAGGVSPVGPIALGVGAAALVAGAVVGGLLVVENDALTGMGTDGVCPGAARAQAEHVEGLAIATDVLLIGGGLVALTGLVLTLVLREASPDAPPVSA